MLKKNSSTYQGPISHTPPGLRWLAVQHRQLLPRRPRVRAVAPARGRVVDQGRRPALPCSAERTRQRVQEGQGSAAELREVCRALVSLGEFRRRQRHEQVSVREREPRVVVRERPRVSCFTHQH